MVNAELGLKELESILYTHPKQEERDRAGKGILEFYYKYKGYYNTRRIIKDQKISGLRKELRGKTTIERIEKIDNIYFQNRGYHILAKMFEIGNISEELREKVGERIIRCYVYDKNYNELMQISQDRKFSNGLREKAKNGLKKIGNKLVY